MRVYNFQKLKKKSVQIGLSVLILIILTKANIIIAVRLKNYYDLKDIGKEKTIIFYNLGSDILATSILSNVNYSLSNIIFMLIEI